jgi:hypothetical protein
MHNVSCDVTAVKMSVQINLFHIHLFFGKNALANCFFLIFSSLNVVGNRRPCDSLQSCKVFDNNVEPNKTNL